MNPKLKRLLEEAQASNGGGVWTHKYDRAVVMGAQCRGLIVVKKGHVPVAGHSLLVITCQGRGELALAQSCDKLELIKREMTKPINGPDFTSSDTLPWGE